MRERNVPFAAAHFSFITRDSFARVSADTVLFARRARYSGSSHRCFSDAEIRARASSVKNDSPGARGAPRGRVAPPCARGLPARATAARGRGGDASAAARRISRCARRSRRSRFSASSPPPPRCAARSPAGRAGAAPRAPRAPPPPAPAAARRARAACPPRSDAASPRCARAPCSRASSPCWPPRFSRGSPACVGAPRAALPPPPRFAVRRSIIAPRAVVRRDALAIAAPRSAAAPPG